MRISEARYSRDRLRFDLALRFIQHEARTSTIRLWTGLTDDRIRKMVRSYVTENDDGERVTRHRGKSPQQASYFTRSVALRQETAVLASVCYLLGVMPMSRIADAHRALPGVQRGEALCEAFEIYGRLVRSPHISFEHAVYMVTALARGDEICATLCGQCQGLIVVDRSSEQEVYCYNCEVPRPGRLL
jgi:hypothetical protein